MISSNKVVTAAHCIHEKNSPKFENDDLRVWLGAYNFGENREKHRQIAKIDKIKLHESWRSDGHNYEGDIAVITLKKTITFNKYIKPICLSSDLSGINNAAVTGWGLTENNTLPNTPRKIDIPILTDKKCYETDYKLARIGWDKSLCAGKRGVSVCKGDSGSALYVEKDNRFYLRGIVSSKIQIFNEACVESYLAIYSDVTKYIDFIDSI